MKTLLLISILFLCSFAQAALTQYNYSGKVMYTNNELYFTTGEIVSGTFSISDNHDLIDVTNWYNGHRYTYRDYDPSAHSTFNSNQTQMDVTNASPSEFIYDVDTLDGISSLSLKSKRNWAYEIFLDIRDIPGVMTTIPSPIDFNSANSVTMFVQQEGNFADIEITSIEVFDGNTCQAFCSFDFELNVSSTQLKKAPQKWSATITNKSEQESVYSYWLTASQNGGVEYPLSETKTISVASGAVVTTVNYRFRPKNIPGSGEWQLILNMQNETENEGPYQRSIAVIKQ